MQVRQSVLIGVKIHYVYRIVCLVSGRYYHGLRSSHDLFDGYMGSSEYLDKHIAECTSEHRKYVLDIFPSREEAGEHEQRLIRAHWNDPLQINRGVGSHNFGSNQGGENNSQYGTMWITNGTDSKRIGRDEEIPDGWQRGRRVPSLQGRTNPNKSPDNHCLCGKKIKRSAKTCMSCRRKPIACGPMTKAQWIARERHRKTEYQSGSKNSQYGSRWLTNGVVSRKAKGEEISHLLLEGWNYGRAPLSSLATNE